MNFSLIATILFHLVLFYFFWLCLKRCQERHLQDLEYVILFCALLTISMFFSKRQFGRLDMYMLAFSLICAVAFVKGKGRWLAVPLSVLGMLVHQDYMFLYMNLVLVLLAYQALSVEGRARRTYWILAGVSLVAAVLWRRSFLTRENMTRRSSRGNCWGRTSRRRSGRCTCKTGLKRPSFCCWFRPISCLA